MIKTKYVLFLPLTSGGHPNHSNEYVLNKNYLDGCDRLVHLSPTHLRKGLKGTPGEGVGYTSVCPNCMGVACFGHYQLNYDVSLSFGRNMHMGTVCEKMLKRDGNGMEEILIMAISKTDANYRHPVLVGNHCSYLITSSNTSVKQNALPDIALLVFYPRILNKNGYYCTYLFLPLCLIC